MSISLLHFDTVQPSKADVKNKWSNARISSIRLYFVNRDNLILPYGWIPIFGEICCLQFQGGSV
jgi:hypothetical protein